MADRKKDNRLKITVAVAVATAVVTVIMGVILGIGNPINIFYVVLGGAGAELILPLSVLLVYRWVYGPEGQARQFQPLLPLGDDDDNESLSGLEDNAQELKLSNKSDDGAINSVQSTISGVTNIGVGGSGDKFSDNFRAANPPSDSSAPPPRSRQGSDAKSSVAQSKDKEAEAEAKEHKTTLRAIWYFAEPLLKMTTLKTADDKSIQRNIQTFTDNNKKLDAILNWAQQNQGLYTQNIPGKLGDQTFNSLKAMLVAVQSHLQKAWQRFWTLDNKEFNLPGIYKALTVLLDNPHQEQWQEKFDECVDDLSKIEHEFAMSYLEQDIQMCNLSGEANAQLVTFEEALQTLNQMASEFQLIHLNESSATVPELEKNTAEIAKNLQQFFGLISTFNDLTKNTHERINAYKFAGGLLEEIQGRTTEGNYDKIKKSQIIKYAPSVTIDDAYVQAVQKIKEARDVMQDLLAKQQAASSTTSTTSSTQQQLMPKPNILEQKFTNILTLISQEKLGEAKAALEALKKEKHDSNKELNCSMELAVSAKGTTEIATQPQKTTVKEMLKHVSKKLKEAKAAQDKNDKKAKQEKKKNDDMPSASAAKAPNAGAPKKQVRIVEPADEQVSGGIPVYSSPLNVAALQQHSSTATTANNAAPGQPGYQPPALSPAL